MATLAINAGDQDARPALRAAVAGLAPGQPIVIMVHGFRFCPQGHATDPHRHILSDSPEIDHWKAVSWPQKLGLQEGGLKIAFGWSAGGTIWTAYDRATQAGADLSALLRDIAACAPGHPVHLIAHSLGARVALIALGQGDRRLAHRAILISPAVFRAEAERIAKTTPAGDVEIFSILSRENTAYDMMLRAVFPHRGRTLGCGGPDHPRWLDVNLGAPHVTAALDGLGHSIAPARSAICHWSGYLRGGVWGFYRALIQRPAETPMPLLRSVMAGPTDPFQSRLRVWSLPFRAGTSS